MVLYLILFVIFTLKWGKISYLKLFLLTGRYLPPPRPRRVVAKVSFQLPALPGLWQRKVESMSVQSGFYEDSYHSQ